MRFAFFLPILALVSGTASAAGGPAGYPATLMDAPATLTEPPAPFVRLGKPVVTLEKTTLEDVALRTGGMRLSEGRGIFLRDILCLAGTEGGRPMRLWLIATDGPRVSEAQLEWMAEGEKPDPVCRSLSPERLPVRLGKVGLGMTKEAVLELLGPASLDAADGWHYWFSQRFLRNERNFQMLELNWLGVRFEDGRAVRLFSSQATNP